jgi:Ca-activated chloride channel family protein
MSTSHFRTSSILFLLAAACTQPAATEPLAEVGGAPAEPSGGEAGNEQERQAGAREDKEKAPIPVTSGELDAVASRLQTDDSKDEKPRADPPSLADKPAPAPAASTVTSSAGGVEQEWTGGVTGGVFGGVVEGRGRGTGSVSVASGRGSASPPGKSSGSYDRPVTLPPAESNTEDFQDYGVNGFTLVEKDALSTFAVDVDTASYTVSRRKLKEGYLPPQAAVRVEEFVNYFPYEYRQPAASDPFLVDVEASPSPYNPQNHLVRIGVQGRRVDLARKPVHLTFLVDVSGSMQAPDKLGLVKDTLKMLTQELEDGDTVAIATYAGSERVVLDPTPMSKRDRILGALDGLTAGGSTAMGAGIDLAYGLADRTYSSGAVNRVIIASDGDANVGVTSHSELTAKIKGYAQKGITLTTLGFGNGNYKDTMMERLANEGDGNYYYIDSLQESRRLFVDKLSSTLEVIAKDVKIQVDWNPEAVIAYRLVGYENRDVADRDFRNDAVDAGEIGAGHQVTALYEVALRDQPVGGLGTVRIRNKAPGPDAPAVERSSSISASVVRARFDLASSQFRLATAAMGFAELLRGSPYMNETTFGQVQAIARAAQRVEYPEDRELVELIGIAGRLRGEGSMVQR